MLASVSVSGGEAAAQASTTPVPSFPCNFSSECSGFLELAGVQDAIFSCNFGRCVKARPVNDVWQLSESTAAPHYTGFSTLVKHRSRVWSRLAPSYTTTCPGWQSAPTTGTVTAGVSSDIPTHIELSKNKSIHIWNYRKNADLCFCHHGRCSNIKWECHTASECKAHQKCKDKKCVCVGKFEVYIFEDYVISSQWKRTLASSSVTQKRTVTTGTTRVTYRRDTSAGELWNIFYYEEQSPPLTARNSWLEGFSYGRVNSTIERIQDRHYIEQEHPSNHEFLALWGVDCCS